MSIDTLPKREATSTQSDVSPAAKPQLEERPPRLSELVAERARMRPEQLRTAQGSSGFKKAFKAIALSSIAIPFVLNPVGMVIAAGVGLYILGQRAQNKALMRENEELTQLLKDILALQQTDKQAEAKGEPQVVDQNQAPEEQQVADQQKAPKEPTTDERQTSEPRLALPFALHQATEKTRSEGKRKGPIRSILSFIAGMFKKVFQHYRENHTIKGLQEKVFSLEMQAAEINAHYDQQIADAEQAVRQGIEEKFAFNKLESIEGKSPEQRRQDMETAAALSEGLAKYRENTNPEASLAQFLLEANKDSSLVDQYQVPKHVMDEVAKSANGITLQKDQIEGYRREALDTIEAKRAPAVHRLQTKLGRRERHKEVFTHFREKLQAGKEKITGAPSRHKEAGYAR